MPAAEANTIRIGRQGTQKATFTAGVYGSSVSGSTVVVNSTGKLGVASSCARLKRADHTDGRPKRAVLNLRIVTFHYKEEVDPEKSPQFGLVAEDVEKVAPELVVHDKKGKPFTVRYEAINAMLPAEFLKEHRKVEEQGATIFQQWKEFESKIAQQQKQIEALIVGLKEQGSQIQKLSEQLNW